jgi:hypothetical protein
VIQIHGAPVKTEFEKMRHEKSRDWFYQAIAPLATLAAVRTAGQIAHNDIELHLLQQKWNAEGIPIHTVTFEFPGKDAPLSWHLTPEDIRHIEKAWIENMSGHKRRVMEFLNGSDRLGCGCPRCKLPPEAR